MEGLIAITALVMVPVSNGAILLWVLGPLDRAAKNRRYPIQFGLADLLCLFVLVQPIIGLLHWASRDDPNHGVVILDVLFGAIIIVLWWFCVRTLSRAGIHVVWQRCTILTLVMPGAYAGSIAVIVLPFVSGSFFLDRHPATAGWLLLVEVALLIILYLFSRFTRAAVASTKNVVRATLVEDEGKNSREPTARGEQ
jgi:hypothetical protein